MADTYTSSLRLRKQATNANKNEWGGFLNEHALDPVDFAIAGVTTISLASGNASLTAANGEADQARAAMLVISATGGVARTLTIPALSKVYLIRNAGTSAVLIKANGVGTGVTVLQGTERWVYCTGSECYRVGSSQWGLLSSTAAPVAQSCALQLTVTGQQFNDALIVLKGVNKGTSEVTYVQFSTDGVGYATGNMPAGSGNAPLYGAVHIPNFRAGAGLASVHVSNDHDTDNTTEYAVGATNSPISWRFSAGISHVQFQNTSANFSAGTFEVWLR